MSVYDYAAPQADGSQQSLAEYQGKVLVIVNTASQCGLASQLQGLEDLYQSYKDRGLVVLGFPCNQFAGQEPGDNEQIQESCALNFGVRFPLFAKVKVNGKEALPLFKYLRKESSAFLTDRIKWNYTKFLIDRQGQVVKRYAPTQPPSAMEENILKLLEESV